MTNLTNWTKPSIPAIFFLAALALCSAASAQTDVAASLYGAFSGTTNGNGTVQSPSNSAGGLLELRHIDNPLIGYDVTYSYNRANQTYKFPAGQPCPTGGCTVAAVSANAHELTGDWVVSLHGANLRPFALAGVGLLFNEPTGNQSNTASATKPAFVYGAGIDWGLLPHIGVRFQYRGNLYKAPNLSRLFTSTGAFTHTSEPMLGVYFRL
ncbi:MAG TPA: outer membrane beta-barrel protein [Terracidiphilus sp.]|jgi:opacity protein-like surface antigen|nr:outer membrane beta-barrel protein [Terracidiphilus sp.]